ncbi:MAG: DNRLRE domain-containing protein [Candidatus Marinimicrobia bacterium]|nr:DNRLRE domain-containing protein [Candidatus Neomarinimicrobiota bacterium]
MKLLKSWNNYKDSKHPHGRLTLSKNRFPVYHNSQFAFLAFALLIFSCEEKIPTIQNPGGFFDFSTLTIPADSMIFAQAVVTPDIGQSDVLYIGNDENVYAYTLLKFGKIKYYLPDSVGEFISLKLNLRSDHQYRLNDLTGETVGINVYHLVNNGIDPWTESSSSVYNFNIDSLNCELLTEFNYSDSDTVVFDLDPILVSQWYDSSDKDYTLVFKQADTTIAAIQTFYSSEASYYPWLEISYQADGDTLTANILPTEDLSILKFKKPVDSSTLFNINSGRASFSVLKFGFEDILTDENEYIAKADLRVSIDPVLTQRYGDIFYLYVNLADSSILDAEGNLDPGYDPVDQSYDFYVSVGVSDTVAVINIKSLLQGVVSKYIDNYGIVLYTVPTFLNISTLSLYNASDQNPAGVRPSLHILTMKEQ